MPEMHFMENQAVLSLLAGRNRVRSSTEMLINTLIQAKDRRERKRQYMNNVALRRFREIVTVVEKQ